MQATGRLSDPAVHQTPRFSGGIADGPVGATGGSGKPDGAAGAAGA